MPMLDGLHLAYFIVPLQSSVVRVFQRSVLRRRLHMYAGPRKHDSLQYYVSSSGAGSKSPHHRIYIFLYPQHYVQAEKVPD